ncbi:MAG: redox-sensing transcriptional repressor Rex, partial [Clostridiales bacterium]|nr:redox-sensing transcriptional repressor Rex [Clostridiales bacterium]
YNVRYLYEEIGKILGLDRQHNMIVIGAGNMGQALANYTNFERRGFVVTALFDVNPDIIGTEVRDRKVYGLDELPAFAEENIIDIAVLSLPKKGAEMAAQMLVDLDIRGILNFAHIDLDLPEGFVVENVHLSDSLMRLSYNMR